MGLHICNALPLFPSKLMFDFFRSKMPHGSPVIRHVASMDPRAKTALNKPSSSDTRFRRGPAAFHRYQLALVDGSNALPCAPTSTF
ncbi:hypothetical protein BC834DRAFT_185061 [Gloeopeniophorella convolvens]|nr:hypothetical protein BC834DRAFT_185061 [Gloeopeniophorella convolvens]